MKGQKGATLVEILISLAVVLVGMAGMFRVLASSVQGSSSASKLGQAQIRAEIIIESIRSSPAAARICLAGTAPSGWSTCEAACRTAIGALATLTSCIFTVDAMDKLAAPDVNSTSPASAATGLKTDRSNQVYFIVASGSGAVRDDTFVLLSGTNRRVYDIQVAIGWNDDGKPTVSDTTKADHSVTLRTGVFQ